MAFSFDAYSDYTSDILNFLGVGESDPFISEDVISQDKVTKFDVEDFVNSNVSDFDTLDAAIQEKIYINAIKIFAGYLYIKFDTLYPRIVSDGNTSYTLEKIDYVAKGNMLIDTGKNNILEIVGVDVSPPAMFKVSPDTDIVTGG